jgi:hypothetical protein
MHSHGDFARHRPRGNRRRPKGRRRSHRPRKYSVGEFIGAYIRAIAALIVAAAVSPALAVLSYIPIGIYLSRYIDQRVDWWIITASVKNVSIVKLHTIITWPVTVPVFIFHVFIAKFL